MAMKIVAPRDTLDKAVDPPVGAGNRKGGVAGKRVGETGNTSPILEPLSIYLRVV